LANNFISLADSKANKKGNIVVTVTKIGELKSGSSTAGDWMRKSISVIDASGIELMSVWNKDIEKFTLNHKYELTGIYWKDSNGKSYLNFGQYSKLRDCGISVEPNQSTIDKTTEPIVKLQPLTGEKLEFVEDRGILLYKIRMALEKKIKTVSIDPHPGMIWEMTETIYQDYKEKYLK